SGHRLLSLADPVKICGGELLLTNRPARDFGKIGPGCEVLKLSSPTDRLTALMRALGKPYGRSRYFHPETAAGQGKIIRRLIGLAKKPFAGKLAPQSTGDAVPAAASTSTPAIPPGRNIVFRVNVDWDAKGLELLDRWCDRYRLRPTLAVAASEIKGHEKRLQDFASRHSVEIASHSFSHYVALPSQSISRQHSEISDNHNFLQDLFGQPVSGFVAPYLKYDRRTFELLAEQGCHWFIRSWQVHPVALAGFNLLDLGVNFFFSTGWENRLPWSLARSDLVFQLHLRDLVSLEHRIEWMLEYLAGQKVRFLDCSTYYELTRERCFL
ncbi:MAG: polysaccharide deacetylase family protein, partial [Gemmatimonadota bacterium]|nr:polysaccharide deacetylase family protein [Gemmatimonadota bacterium]